MPPFKFPLAWRIVCLRKVLYFPPNPPPHPRAVCFLFSLGGLCATCNHFSIPSAFEADLLNCFDAFSVSQFAFLQSTFGVCFLRAERISLVSHPYRLSLLTSSVPKPPPSRPDTRNPKPQFRFSTAWTDVKMIYKALWSQCHGPAIASVYQLLDCLPGLAY